jgi:hypothetical protein
VPKPAAEFGRATEGLLDGDQLVEGEADEQGQWVADEQAVGLVVAGERESIDRSVHEPMVVAQRWR